MGMANLQRMAQQMQQEMLRVQDELEATTVDGSAGGGVVSATVTGKQELVSVTIDPSAVDPEDVEMLQDLVMAAVNDALRASRERAEQKMGAVTAGLRIPGIGPKSVDEILKARRTQKFRDLTALRKMGIIVARAAPFLLLDGRRPETQMAMF